MMLNRCPDAWKTSSVSTRVSLAIWDLVQDDKHTCHDVAIALVGYPSCCWWEAWPDVLNVSWQVEMLLSLARESVTLKVCNSDKCMVVLVAPFIGKDCLAEDDGVRLLEGVHELHMAYRKLLSHLKIAYMELPAMPVSARVEHLSDRLSLKGFAV